MANAEIYVIFEVFAFCGGRTKTDFKDRADKTNPHDMFDLLFYLGRIDSMLNTISVSSEGASGKPHSLFLGKFE